MSIIKTQEFEVAGKTFTKQMTYRSGGKFEIKVPAEIGEVVHTLCVSGKTEAECDESFTRVVVEFAGLRQKKDKVILYRIDLEGKIKDARGKVIYSRGHFTDDRGVKIQFDYMVANRIRYGGTVAYFNDDGKKVWIGGESVMEWTPDREAFFSGFQAALEQAILRADTFFGKNSQKLAKLIDAKKLPLLLGGPKA
jgi:hypothetical protein